MGTQLAHGTKTIAKQLFPTVKKGLEEEEISMFLFQFITHTNPLSLWELQQGHIGDGRHLRGIQCMIEVAMRML